MSKKTGIIFIDIASEIKDRVPRRPPVKTVSLLFVILMVFSAFTILNFATQPVKASPPATGDKSFFNTSFSTDYADVQSGSSSSYSATFGEQGSAKVYVHIKDNNSNQANSTVLNQTINPAAAPASPSFPSVNTSNIHPLTTTRGYVYFNETGLPSGTSWSVTYNGLNSSSTSTSIKFSETVNVLYSYTVHNSNVGGKIYTPSPSSGSAKAPSSVSITFSFVSLTASATASHNPSDVGQDVNYTFTVSGGVSPYTIEYQFGSGGSIFSLPQGQMYVNYVWQSSGTQDAYFKVSDSASPKDWYNFTYTQTVDPALTVSITASTSTIDYGQSVTFTATASGGSGTYSYQWYLNGTAVSGATSSTWTTTTLPTGDPTIYVKVTDSNSFTVQSNTITETVYADPTVTASGSPNPSDAGQTVTFTATVTYSGTISSYAWYVAGALQSSTTSTMSYTFTSSGSYSIEIEVTDSLGGHGYYNFTQTVDPDMTVSLSVNAAYDENIYYSFSPSVSGGTGSYTNYAWYVNGAYVGSGNPLSYEFTSTGSYSMYVAVTDSSDSVVNSNTVSFTVNPPVSVTVSASPNPASVDQTYTLTASVSGGTSPYSYQWYIVSGSTETAISGATSSTYSASQSTAGTIPISYTWQTAPQDMSILPR